MYTKKKFVVRGDITPPRYPFLSCGKVFIVGDDVIDFFEFGSMVIDGRRYISDLIIYPDGRIRDGWRRGRGHVLARTDVQTLVEAGSETIIAGTGIHGRMKPEPGLEKMLGKMRIQFKAGPNDQAVLWYNDRSATSKVGACFHLSC